MRDKILVKKVITYTSGRNIYIWSCFMPNRNMFGQVSIKYGLLTQEQFDKEYGKTDWRVDHKDLLFSYGIYTAIKGMPTTIEIQNPNKGKDGYWNNMFFIIQDDNSKFDIGRKTVPGQTQKLYKNLVGDIFAEITSLANKYGNRDEVVLTNPIDRVEIQKSIDSIPELKSDIKELKFLKIPNNQEASVAAIFYELIGAGTIKEITPVTSAYRNRYDLYANINGKLTFFEFKSSISNLLSDFDEYVKIFDEIDYIVCWEITDEDIANFKKEAIELNQIKDLGYEDNPDKPYVDITTHYLKIQHVKPVYVIDLKQIVVKE